MDRDIFDHIGLSNDQSYTARLSTGQRLMDSTGSQNAAAWRRNSQLHGRFGVQSAETIEATMALSIIGPIRRVNLVAGPAEDVAYFMPLESRD